MPLKKFNFWSKALTYLVPLQGTFDICLILKAFSFFYWSLLSWLEYVELVNWFLVCFHLPFRLLCAMEGKYLVQGNCIDMVVGADSCMDHNEIQSLSFPCTVPNATGRGFIEVIFFSLMLILFPIPEQSCSDYCEWNLMLVGLLMTLSFML